MNKDNIFLHPNWIMIFNIIFTLILFCIFSLSFFRTFKFCKWINKSQLTNENIDFNCSKRLFLVSIISGITTYIYFCFAFTIHFTDAPLWPLVSGISIMEWDNANNWKYGFIIFLIGILVWTVLNFTLTFFIALSHKCQKILNSQKLKVALISSATNIPAILLIQFIYVFNNFEKYFTHFQ